MFPLCSLEFVADVGNGTFSIPFSCDGENILDPLFLRVSCSNMSAEYQRPAVAVEAVSRDHRGKDEVGQLCVCSPVGAAAEC